jgi:hypothetical protein
LLGRYFEKRWIIVGITKRLILPVSVGGKVKEKSSLF